MVFTLIALTLISLLIGCWQWAVAWRFPLHQKVLNTAFTPAITVLKPLKGWDSRSADCLRSWLGQEYPAGLQILFGVSSPHDPAVGGLSRLLKEYPECNAELVLCSESLGANSKVSKLIQLLRRAENEIIVVSDADVLAPPEYLANVVAPLQTSDVGLVNSFYRLANPSTVAMRWEAVAINADFWSQVLQGQSLQPLDFALGAVMVTRRELLEEIGGFEGFADYLADDYQLGNRIARTGKRIALCPVVVDCFSAPMNWRQVWDHQLRWARTIRACKPVPYALSILNNATLWPLLWLAAQPVARVSLAVGCCLLARIVMAHSLQKRLSPNGKAGHYWWLAPVKDLKQFLLWLLSFFGDSIEWRGQRFRLQSDGKLTPVSQS